MTEKKSENNFQMENLIGFHTSLGSDYQHLFETIESFHLPTFQVFTKNHRQWKEKEISPVTGDQVKNKLHKAGIHKAMSHCTYLINLASSDETIREKSILALAAELIRCDTLGISYAVLHPGASRERSETESIEKIVDGLKLVLSHTKKLKVKVLLENTAGQGSSIGWKFEQLRDIFALLDFDLGVCFDTCHAFAANYDVRNHNGIEKTLNEFDRIVGIEKLHAFHLNDSKGALGSRIDRHEHMGKGKIGLETFEYIIKTFPDKPKIIETNHDDNLHIKDLEILRGLI